VTECEGATWGSPSPSSSSSSRSFLVLLALVSVLGTHGRAYLDQGASRLRGVATGSQSVPLTDLRDVQQLGAAFDRAVGHPRLVLFLSPT
jgi:hypothetical protein